MGKQPKKPNSDPTAKPRPVQPVIKEEPEKTQPQPSTEESSEQPKPDERPSGVPVYVEK